jgi:hypothetical protein
LEYNPDGTIMKVEQTIRVNMPPAPKN